MGVYDLGLSDNQFWQLTSGQFQALCARKKIKLYQSRFDFAALYTLIFNMVSKDHKISLDDYLGEVPDQDQAQKIDKARDRVKAIKQAFLKIFPKSKQKKPKGNA